MRNVGSSDFEPSDIPTRISKLSLNISKDTESMISIKEFGRNDNTSHPEIM